MSIPRPSRKSLYAYTGNSPELAKRNKNSSSFLLGAHDGGASQQPLTRLRRQRMGAAELCVRLASLLWRTPSIAESKARWSRYPQSLLLCVIPSRYG